ncbi:hypothetical protein NLJ89_g6981 [Agrocybe chaxingu]|uniref:F-box domain-containing protein n=1 Tax=Agrocybe chaxingu TaxID=84603 RepID=A0A9W8MVW3_9AGAR|nr:hypothetical protein NLJ89_g6981 [Agrocybe chaxingu]
MEHCYSIFEFKYKDLNHPKLSHPLANPYVNYSWKVEEPGIFSSKTKGFDPERVARISSAETRRLVPMSQDISSYIQGIGIAPTQVETAILEDLRATRRKEIQEIKSQRDEMLRSIKTLCEDLLAMEETLEGKTREAAIISSILAPIRRLPLELLIKIFCLTTRGQQAPPHYDRPPMVICQVCTLWRNIALKDPFLWTDITFDYPVWEDYIHSDEEYGSDGEELTPSRDEGPVIEDYQRLVRRVQVFVHRSGNAPLFLTIGNHPTDTIRVANPSPMLQTCRQTASNLMVSLFPRCRSVEFYVEHGWAISFFKGLAQGVFSNLERLEINFSHELTTGPPAETRVFTFSSLRHYRLYSEFPRELARISVPCSSLKTLELVLSDGRSTETELTSAEGVRMWRNFLLQCTNLRDAFVSYSSKRFPAEPSLDEDMAWITPNSDSRAPLAHLTKLHIRTNVNASASVMLRGLDLPALTSLFLETHHHGKFSLVPKGAVFTDTILREMPYVAQLTMLNLTRVAVDDEDLYSLLHITTQLEILSILKGEIQTPNSSTRSMTKIWTEDSRGLIQFLTINENQQKKDFSPPLPRLRTLNLYYGNKTSGDRVPPSSYAQIAHSRYQWMLRHSDRPELRSGKEITFEKSPFRMCIVVEKLLDKARYAAITALLQEAIGPLHTSVLRTAPCYSLALGSGGWESRFSW